MAAEKQEEEILSSSFLPPRAQFLEVLCKSSGKMRRFAAGTAAGWALHRMNETLDDGLPQGLRIEAVKEGEEPVSFGPSAVLAHYGRGWSLQTIPEEDHAEARTSRGTTTPGPSPFLEIKCRSTGKVWRFAPGTRAGYALLQMNQKLELGLPRGLGIEGVKDGEEPVRFGPDAILVGCGQGWSLQTAFDEGHGQARRTAAAAGPRPFDGQPNPAYAGAPRKPSGGHITPGYIGRIALAFVFMFFLGGLLTLFLEYLPALLAFISSSA